MFSSLKIREFRIFWFSMLVSLVGTWIQSMAQSWLVFRMTHSAFLLGLVGFLNYLPVAFFSLAAGVFVDRAVKRNLLLATQAALALLAFALAMLVQTRAIAVWHVLVIAFLNGLVFSVDAPARQAMVVDLVGRQHLFNAIVLNSAAFNSARIIGPALAGILIASVGMAGCFYINAASFLPVLFALFLIRPRPVATGNGHNSFFEDIREGISVIKSRRIVWVLLVLVGSFSMFGAAYIVLMPVIAQDVLGTGAKGLAVLMSSSGVGALLGVLSLMRLKPSDPKLGVLRFSMVLFYLALMLFSFSRQLDASAILLGLAGFGGARSMSLANTMLQLNIPDVYRGRAMGAFMMMFSGLMPFGNLLSGFAAHFLGAPRVIFGTAFACLLFYFVMDSKYLAAVRDKERSHEE